MTRVPYVPNPELYRVHYGHGLPVFVGDVQQDGYGLGGFLSSLFRKVMPIVSKTIVPALKRTAKSAGKSLLKTGTRVLSDVVLEDKEFKESLKHRGKEGLNDFIGKVTEMKGGSYKHRAKCLKQLQNRVQKKSKRRKFSEDIFE